jgi:hypothetical protein
MTYREDVRRWVGKVRTTIPDVVTSTALQMHASIVAGSSVSAAPGQPVDTGYLRSSWIVAIGKDPSYPTNGTGAAKDASWSGRKASRPDDPPAPPPPLSAPQVAPNALVASITTNTRYAEYVEQGQHAYRVGGPDSVKLTRAAFGRFVEIAVREQGGR